MRLRRRRKETPPKEAASARPPTEAVTADDDAPTRSPRRHRVVFLVWTTVVAVVAAAALLLGYVPTRAWLAQRRSIADTQGKVEVMQKENARLAEQIKSLSDPAAIEQVARAQFGLVRPGETAYALLPEPPVTGLPAGWPWDQLGGVMQARRTGSVIVP